MARVLDYGALEVERGSVDCGVPNAEVVCESTYEQALEAALAEITGETGRCGVIVFEEGRVGVDIGAEAFADDEFGVWQLEPGVKIGSRSCLDTVIGPERLGPVRRLDGFVGLSARVSGGEGDVASRVPVLGEDDVLESLAEAVDEGDDLIAAIDGERATGAEVVLHIHDQQGVRR